MSSTPFELPELPAPHPEFIAYLAKNPNSSISNLISPYNAYEAKLREGFAQHREHTTLQNPHVNSVPIFNGHEDKVLVQRRSLENETDNQKFIMPLKAEDRKPNGSPAIVQSMKNFKQNFNIFSESSLVDLNWNNVVVAGSSVVTSLLPVPDPYNKSKRALREYYHQKLAPSSDVDLFIWGLDEAAATEKIKEIETRIRNSILAETTTIRTKNAITIASQYPTRHVQIVLRLYKSVSEILTGFDVDCSCFAYDGDQVFGAPRGIAAFMTQINTIDLSRRSPSYESRLSKYSHRGFEVHWPLLERQRIDPTVFERSFVRTMGLARLLVLEALPKPDDRDNYVDQRRAERGRPNLNRGRRDRGKLQGNVKDREPDDVAEWVYEDDVSNYHTFTVPYGPKYHAKRIERLLYTKDILLNAEWNAKKDRTVNLHRHPCFIGDAASVLHDCCGFCPEPITDEEREISEKESKIYVHGDLRFMTDDPGRQAIGSFNPITEDDWTDMAYIGNTIQLCQAICNHDLAYVQEWCGKEDSIIDRRDHTGRTPLQLATQCSTPEIVQCLIDNGARIVARLVDGMTAYHIAATRGSTQMVQALLEKSEANEEKEFESTKRKGTINAKDNDQNKEMEPAEHDRESDEDAIREFDEETGSDDDKTDLTQGSFVKVTVGDPRGELIPDSETESQDPDIYDVNVLAWDAPVSPLHLAILEGHIPVIKQLISQFGADVLLPVKILDSNSDNPRGAIMTVVLAAQLPDDRCTEVSRALLQLGASSAQADMSQISALHHIIARKKVDVLNLMFEVDAVAANGALNHVAVSGRVWSASTKSPLISAVEFGDAGLVQTLLELGAKPRLEFDDWVGPYVNLMDRASTRPGLDGEEAHKTYKQTVMEPVLLAVYRDLPICVEYMLGKGADVNTRVPSRNNGYVGSSGSGQTLLDVVESKIRDLQANPGGVISIPEPPHLKEDSVYLGRAIPGSYEHRSISKDIEVTRDVLREWQQRRDQEITKRLEKKGLLEKTARLLQLRAEFEMLREKILQQGGKSFQELHPSDEPLSPSFERRSSQAQKGFDPRVSFQLPDLTNQKREGYLRLFEAVWRGDEATVKEMTLGSWGPTQQTPPLQIAVQDNSGLSPFSIAIHRKHRHLAKVILDIACVQYQPSDADEPKRRFVINSSSEDDDDNIPISSELVDDVFIIENIADLSKAVGSRVEPRKMLAWRAELWRCSEESDEEAKEAYQSSISRVYIPQFKSTESAFEQTMRNLPIGKANLVSHAIMKGDLDLLQFLIQCCRDVSSSPVHNNASSPAGAFEDIIQLGDLYHALRKGHFEIAAELIKSTGIGLQLGSLATQIDADKSEKPKYYQGLTIYGSKKKEWAKHASGRNRPIENDQVNHPPFLEAVHQGSQASAAWLLSEAPSLYKEFSLGLAKSLDEQKKLHLGITGWLGTRRHLALHCAVLTEPASLEMIRYLIKTVPESLEAKSVSGHTPLGLAFSLGQVEAARELLAAGADPTTRDIIGRNIGHLIVQGVDGSIQDDASKIRNLLQLLDKHVAHELFLERCKEGQGALTPLARGLRSLANNSRNRVSPAVLEVLHEFTNGDDLVLMDGSGQFPLHQAVKASHLEIVKFFINKNPSLLMRENAMGQTPLELAASMFVLHSATTIPTVVLPNYHRGPTPIQDREPHTFLPDYVDETQQGPASVRVYRLCKEIATAHPHPRKLVSVAESSEVACRLALRETQPQKHLGVRRGGYNYSYRRGASSDDDGEKEPVDEVMQWYPLGRFSMYGLP